MQRAFILALSLIAIVPDYGRCQQIPQSRQTARSSLPPQSPRAASWIWYPGDMEVWMGNQMQNRRIERGTFLPPFWKLDNHYVLIDFHKQFFLPAEEDVTLAVEGQYNMKLDGNMVAGAPKRLHIPAGRHTIDMKVFCQDRVPSIFLQGQQLLSDTSWSVTFEDKEWIDATGKVSDKSGTVWLPAASWNFHDPSTPPSRWRLPTEPRSPQHVGSGHHSMLVDFGYETFGYVVLHGLTGSGKLDLYYGESREEALSTDHCETLDRLDIDRSRPGDSVLQGSRAFRFVNLQWDGDLHLDSVSVLYEYSPVATRGAFRCSDSAINRIWDVAAYTLHLNTREFFIDGIKRDRWIWSGDACQSYLMNYYLFFDSATVTRTLLALRGKDPVTSHINTILDYTFYWFLGIYDYYLYTGDAGFIRRFYPRMQSMMDFVLSRRDRDGLVQGLPGDWVFVDWADGLSKRGQLSIEQVLFCRSLETMSLCAGLTDDSSGAVRYRKLAGDVRSKLFAFFWDERKQAFVHSRVAGVPGDQVTRYANMFGIFFGYFSAAQQQAIRQHVLLNDSVQKITTPYMRFYELEALCAMGGQSSVLKEMKDYWGGMLRLGATSFWEKYDPSETGAQHYAMYGRPFGRSLCHAWGAGPIYLLGKYWLGVRPESPGYSTYIVQPALGGLQWMEGDVPTPHGNIHVYCSRSRIRVKGVQGSGTLRFASSIVPQCKSARVARTSDGRYEIPLEAGKEMVVSYEEP